MYHTCDVVVPELKPQVYHLVPMWHQVSNFMSVFPSVKWNTFTCTQSKHVRITSSLYVKISHFCCVALLRPLPGGRSSTSITHASQFYFKSILHGPRLSTEQIHFCLFLGSWGFFLTQLCMRPKTLRAETKKKISVAWRNKAGGIFSQKRGGFIYVRDHKAGDDADVPVWQDQLRGFT